MTAITPEMRTEIKRHLTAHRPEKTNQHASQYRYKGHASEALAVSPEDVPRATEHLRSRGCMADYDKAGRPLVTSDRQFREVARAGGIFTGRDGYCSRDNEGNRILTGREQAHGREEFKRAIVRGDFDL